MVLNPKTPRVLLLVDRWDWAFHTIAKAVERHLGDRFAFEILNTGDRPNIDDSAYDIIHVFYEYETYHRPLLRGHAKVVRSVFSHYWQEWNLSADEFYAKYLRDAHAIVVPSNKLKTLLDPLPPPVHLCSEGVDTDVFECKKTRTGPLTVGWAGDPTRTIKRVEWLKEACNGLCELKLATGDLSQKEMVDFYNSIDVIACSSFGEGCPRPLIEGMACGCFPVSFDVGVASEVIDGDKNGIIVTNESVAGLREALQTCVLHVDDVRSKALANPERMRSTRTWGKTLTALPEIYYSVLG